MYSQKEHQEEWKLKICHLAVLNVSDKNVCDCDSLLDDTSIRREQRTSAVVWVNKRHIIFHILELWPDLAAKKKKKRKEKSYLRRTSCSSVKKLRETRENDTSK